MNIHSYNQLFLLPCIHMHYNNSVHKNRKRTVIAMYIRMPDNIKHSCIAWHIIIHNDKSTNIS